MLRTMMIRDARRELYEQAAEESLYGSKKLARKKEASADSSLTALDDDEEFEWDDGT